VFERRGRFTPTFPSARYLFNREDFEHRLDYDRGALGSFATRVAFRECVLPPAEAGLVDFVDPHACIEQELDHDLHSRHCLDIARSYRSQDSGRRQRRLDHG
jgi:hypothetical protein